MAPAGHGSVGTGVRSADVVDGVLRLTLNNTLDAIDDGRLEILAFLTPADLTDRIINRLEVVFEELVANAVRHSFGRGAPHTLTVAVSLAPDRIAMVFEDDGAPFDPLAVAEPEPFGSPETVRLGGLGLPLIRRLSSEVRYERLRGVGGDKRFEPRNRVSVAIALEAPPQARPGLTV